MEHQTTRTLKHGSATIIVHRPELSDSERAKRERRVRDVLGVTMRDYFKRKETTSCPISK